MAERGGTATQDGIYYQNTVAATYLADLLELTQQPPRERVVEVRVEAPSDVDDVVVRFADGHRDWLQIKTAIPSSGDAWNRLWLNLANQATNAEFGPEDNLLIVAGEFDDTARSVREMCERASTSIDEAELQQRFTARQRNLLDSIRSASGAVADPVELLRRTKVEIAPLSEIERSFSTRRLGSASALPARLLACLRDIAGAGARRRALFLAPSLRQKLSEEFEIDAIEPAEWGLAAYRSTVERLSRIEIPGTGISGTTHELFIWPRARDYQRTNSPDFEDESLAGNVRADTTVDLQDFPSKQLDRCIVVAGPGYGKSALLGAIAAQLTRTPYVPVLIPLPSFTASNVNVLEYLTGEVNREMGVRADWARLAEQGLAVLLFDGLDEIPANRRQIVLGRIATFSARYANVPWLLTVRDPAVLSGPADARIVELLPLDDSDIVRFAEVMRRRIATSSDAEEFARQLRQYPDLSRLARIPLFLAMLVTLTSPSDGMPRRRADLIEMYLKTLFSPFEHKAVVSDHFSVSSLRKVAEALAFERLEKQEVGATEREVLDVASRVATDSEPPEAVLARLLTHGVLRRQSGIRLQFPYPIVQEYLAACYLVTERQESLAHRLGDAVQRPWAQVVQFAIELHRAPEPLIRQMLESRDDAFATGLRLIGRCIANGAKVSHETWAETARRLTNAWRHATWRNRDRIGQLIVDGFSRPLLPEVRDAVCMSRLMHSGAGKVVVHAEDPELTIEVLNSYLASGLHSYTNYAPIQQALNDVGSTTFDIYASMVRQQDVTLDELDGLGSLIESLSPRNLRQERVLDFVHDKTLPDSIRLAALSLTSETFDDDIETLLQRAVRSERYSDRAATMRVLVNSKDSEGVSFEFLEDETLKETTRCELAEYYLRKLPDTKSRRDFATTCASRSCLPERLRNVMRVYAASYGDGATFETLVNELDSLDPDIAEATVTLFGHYPTLELGVRAAQIIDSRVKTSSEAAAFANGAVLGMTHVFEMYSFLSGALHPSRRHPAADVWMDLLDSWTVRYSPSATELLRILTAGSALGSERSRNTLQIKIFEMDPDDAIFDVEDDYGQVFGGAVTELLARRCMLSLSLGARLVRATRPNVQSGGVAVITRHANNEAHDLLISLHNEQSDWHVRSELSDAIETLSGRLGIVVCKSGQELQVVTDIKPNR